MVNRGVIGRRHGQRAGGTATVSIHVRELAQLFNSLDPAPFWDRDLDRAAAEFIEDEFRGRLANSARREMREHLRLGEVALAGGLVIFLLSMGARSILGSLLGHLPILLDEGLIILAWLALWRPAETLIYGWVPFYRNRRLFERLAGIRVLVRLNSTPTLHSRPAAAV